ncbi:MAG: hypothetical protein M1511_04235 [Deltaproteobacteria bacterium]|nr:hypothetical protein [Deltaproteobacteria bacterium]
MRHPGINSLGKLEKIFLPTPQWKIARFPGLRPRNYRDKIVGGFSDVFVGLSPKCVFRDRNTTSRWSSLF